MLKRDLLEWFTSCNPASPSVAVSNRKAKNIVFVQSWRLGVLAGSGLCWSLKKCVHLPVKECTRIDGLARGREGRQAKSNFSFYHVNLYSLPPEDVA